MNNKSNMRNRSVHNRYYDQRNMSVEPCKNCGEVNVSDRVTSLAMVYTVSQCWRLITDGCVGLERGTIFDELNKPFKGDKCKRGGCCK